MPRTDAQVWSRRSVLKAGAGATVAVGSIGFGLGHAEASGGSSRSSDRSGSTAPPSTSSRAPAAGQAFDSRPDLHPPRFEVLAEGPGGSGDGLLLTTPAKGQAQNGPMIMDGAGQLVWFKPMAGGRLATNLRVQRVGGRPVLTWWEGVINEEGWGQGEVIVADASYREMARISTGDGLLADLHDVTITSAGTALITAYHRETADLRPVGGPAGGGLLNSGFQEVDIATGDVVFEWMGRDHVDLTETYAPYPPDPATAPFDFLHANSVGEDLDGNLLLSARHTSAVYKIDRHSGAVLWRLGGRRSDFAVADPAAFAWQHDVTRLADGSLSIFDNGAGISKTQPQSRALVLDLDESASTASLRMAYPHPSPLTADSQGSVQVDPGGDVVVGWGARPYISQFSADGSIRFDGRFLDGGASYRALRAAWTGRPQRRPAASVVSTSPLLQVRVSWNGATEVARWMLVVGDTPAGMSEAGRSTRTGFETTVTAPRTTARLAALVALGAGGEELGRSAPVRL